MGEKVVWMVQQGKQVSFGWERLSRCITAYLFELDPQDQHEVGTAMTVMWLFIPV